jgi:PAS domain S-box-containing protein
MMLLGKEHAMAKQPLLPPEIAKLFPARGAGFTLPAWSLAAALLITLALALLLLIDLSHVGHQAAQVFLQTHGWLLWTMSIGLLASLFSAGWLLWTDTLGKKSLLAERQTFITNQILSFDSARDPILLVHRNGPIELANLAAERLFGHPRSELLGRDVSLLIETEQTSTPLAERLTLSNDELKVGVVREMWGLASDGRRFPIDATIRNMAGGAGERIGIFVRDVSDRRAAQDALRKSEEQFRLLVNGVTDYALFMIDPDGLVTNWNAGAERMSGYTAEEAIGQSFMHFHPDAEVKAGVPQQMLAQALANGRSESQGWRVRKDGSKFWAETILHAVYAESGALIGFAKITRDISERKRIEQLKDEFVSTVNHELRTPLTSIAGSLGLLSGGAGGDLPPGAARLITIAHANCQRLIRLINDMLDVEKIQSGKMRFEMTPLSLTDVARRSVESMRTYGEQPNVAIELEAHADTAVRGDADRLIQVVTNLLSNALKFSPPGGKVTVTVEQIDRLVRLSVRDEGPGIPDEFRSRIFTKFAQADSSDSRQKGGTGLGLVIVKEIVERHGGRLWFDSNPGEGTVFYVDLPAPATGRNAGEIGTDATVLVCEDDDDIAEVLIEFLGREGLAVERAQNLAEARAVLARSNAPQALLLDLVLPDGDGVSLIRELRAQEATQGLPIIVVSAQAQRGRDAIGSQAMNVVDWMEKPIEISRLHRAVSIALRPVTAQRPLILHVEDDPDILQITASALDRCGEIVSAESLSAARTILATRTPDLVILDINLGDGSGLDLLPELSAKSDTLIPVVIFSVQEAPEILLPHVRAVMTKSKTSLHQLAQTVQQLLDHSRPVTERKIA